MFKNIDEFKHLNTILVLRCVAIIYTVLTVAYAIEYFKGNRTLTYVVIFIAMLWISYGVARFCYTIPKFSNFLPYIICLGYIIFYLFCMTTTIVGETWIYAFPFSCVLPFFFTNIGLVVFTYSIFILINIVDVLLNSDIYLSTTANITELEQRFACLLLVFSFLIVICYLLRRYEQVVTMVYKEGAIDPISGLHSKDYVIKKLEPMINDNKNLSYTLVFINIDRFSAINAGYGHSYGDTVLELVGSTINEELEPIRSNSFSSRIYGDKFLIIFSNRTYEEVREYYKIIKQHLDNLVVKKNNQELFIRTTVCVTDTRFCEHTYNALYKRVRYLQDLARSKGDNNLLEDVMNL